MVRRVKMKRRRRSYVRWVDGQRLKECEKGVKSGLLRGWRERSGMCWVRNSKRPQGLARRADNARSERTGVLFSASNPRLEMQDPTVEGS